MESFTDSTIKAAVPDGWRSTFSAEVGGCGRDSGPPPDFNNAFFLFSDALATA